MDGDEDAGDRSPGGADTLMLAVPNFNFSSSSQANEMQEAALLLSKLVTPLRQSDITPLSFVSLQLEKVQYERLLIIGLAQLVATLIGSTKLLYVGPG